jgi:Icc-related predicted phosphoesterase
MTFSKLFIYAISDIHTDLRQNLELISKLSNHGEHVLIVAGDISDDIHVMRSTLKTLCKKFKTIFFTPGNHDLWLRKDEEYFYDSLEKLDYLMQMCAELGVHTSPCKVNEEIVVFPLFSWHNFEFDDSFTSESESEEIEKLCNDYRFCKWPQSCSSISDLMLSLNEEHIEEHQQLLRKEPHLKTISFSHFLPRRELLPAKHLLCKRISNILPKVCGCLDLDVQIRRIQSCLHIYGHTHIEGDHIIDGVRYVQNPLGYPRENIVRNLSGSFKPLLVYPLSTTDEKKKM